MGILLSYLLPVPKIIEHSPSDPKTYFRWKIQRFQTTWTNAHVKNQTMYSEEFALKTQPSIRLSLYFNATKDTWMENSYGVDVRDFSANESIELSYKIWFENKRNEKFNEQPFVKNVFDEKVRGRGWVGIGNLDLFKNIVESNGTLYMCCEIVDLHLPKDVYENFCLNHWQLYEDGIHDTIVFVGPDKQEFKILKTFFMAQSPVFKAMFQSENFTEGQTNELWIKDMEEETMLALIKWLYLAKIEDEGGSLENLFEAADKYQIDMLKSECVKCMISTLNDKNMLQRLAFAGFYNQKFLGAQILNYIETRPRLELLNAIMSQEWIDFADEKTYAAAELSNLISEKLK